MFINFVELKKSSELRANSNSNSKLELDVVGNSPKTEGIVHDGMALSISDTTITS